MSAKDNVLQDWSFHVEEVSVGVYLVTGTDRAGRKVEKKGIDPDSLVAECKQDAAEMLLRDERGR